MLNLRLTPWKPKTKEEALIVGEAEEAVPKHIRRAVVPIRNKAIREIQKAEKAIGMAIGYLARLDDAIKRTPKAEKYPELLGHSGLRDPAMAAKAIEYITRTKASQDAERAEYAAMTEVPEGASMWMEFEWTVPESGRSTLPRQLQRLQFDGDRVRGFWEHHAAKVHVLIAQMRNSLSESAQSGSGGAPKKYRRNYMIEFLDRRGENEKTIAEHLKREGLDVGPLPKIQKRVRAYLDTKAKPKGNPRRGRKVPRNPA